MIRKRPSPKNGKVIVTFEIPGTIWAERINLVGDFNNWDPHSLPFRRNWQGTWQIELELEAGRKYSFRYLLDGQDWRDDWHADGHEPNPYGGHNSIVVASLSPEERR
jgi:1,4-alpha-glucan branching enzyme